MPTDITIIALVINVLVAGWFAKNIYPGPMIMRDIKKWKERKHKPKEG